MLSSIGHDNGLECEFGSGLVLMLGLGVSGLGLRPLLVMLGYAPALGLWSELEWSGMDIVMVTILVRSTINQLITYN